jgi:phage gpG-like protein
VKLVIDSVGDEIVSRELLRLAGRVGNVEPAMESILRQIRAGEEQQFNSQGSYGSGGWAPLAPSTLEAKARSGIDPRILHGITGDLEASLTGAGGENIAITRHDGLDFGTTVPYARYHQDGRGVPMRKPAQFPDSARRHWIKTIQDHVLGTGTL